MAIGIYFKRTSVSSRFPVYSFYKAETNSLCWLHELHRTFSRKCTITAASQYFLTWFSTLRPEIQVSLCWNHSHAFSSSIVSCSFSKLMEVTNNCNGREGLRNSSNDLRKAQVNSSFPGAAHPDFCGPYRSNQKLSLQVQVKNALKILDTYKSRCKIELLQRLLNPSAKKIVRLKRTAREPPTILRSNASVVLQIKVCEDPLPLKEGREENQPMERIFEHRVKRLLHIMGFIFSSARYASRAPFEMDRNRPTILRHLKYIARMFLQWDFCKLYSFWKDKNPTVLWLRVCEALLAPTDVGKSKTRKYVFNDSRGNPSTKLFRGSAAGWMSSWSWLGVSVMCIKYKICLIEGLMFPGTVNHSLPRLKL